MIRFLRGIYQVNQTRLPLAMVQHNILEAIHQVAAGLVMDTMQQGAMLLLVMLAQVKANAHLDITAAAVSSMIVPAVNIVQATAQQNVQILMLDISAMVAPQVQRQAAATV